MSFFLTKWVKGWRLDKFFENLFQHSDNGEISVKDAAIKVSGVIDQTLLIWNEYKPFFDTLFSDDAEASADRVEAEIEIIQGKLLEIQTLPDIAESLKQYRFANDDKRNDFYHSLVSTSALMFNDGKISVFEAVSFLVQIIDFIKSTK